MQTTVRLAWPAVAAASALGVLAAPLRCQDADLARRLAELERTNAALAARVGELEDAAAAQHLIRHDDDDGLVARYRDVVATFQVFADVGARFDDPEVPGRSNSTFDFGLIDFVVNAQLGDRFRFLSETVIDPESDGDISLSQERLWGMWTLDDALYAKLGTEHSPVSRWNQLYHHGRWLETTISRPIAVQFEGAGGILPLHRTGLELGGRLGGELGAVEYVAAVANGRGIARTHRGAFDDNDSKRLELGLAFLPAALPGLRVGGVLVHDDIPAASGAGNPLSTRELIGAAHVQLDAGGLDVIAEYFRVQHHRRATDSTSDHDAAYLQAAFRVGSWTPYARIDWLDLQGGDPFYAALGDRWLQTVGVRVDVGDVAFKWDVAFGQTDLGVVDDEDLVIAQFQVSWAL